MSINLERLIGVIHKIETWVLAGLAGPFILKLVLDFFGIKPTDVVSVVLANQTVLVIGIFASFALVFKVVHDGRTKLQEWRKYRIPPLEKLTDQQRQYLIGIFNSGSYSVKVHIDTSSQQWFRELEEKNYMEFIQPLMMLGGDPYLPYIMTSKGWKRVEQYVRNSPAQNN